MTQITVFTPFYSLTDKTVNILSRIWVENKVSLLIMYMEEKNSLFFITLEADPNIYAVIQNYFKHCLLNSLIYSTNIYLIRTCQNALRQKDTMIKNKIYLPSYSFHYSIFILVPFFLLFFDYAGSLDYFSIYAFIFLTNIYGAPVFLALC